MNEAPTMKFSRQQGRLSAHLKTAGFTALICGLLLSPIAPAHAAFSSQWQVPGLGKLQLGQPDPRTGRVGATLNVETDRLEGIPRNTVLQMSGTLQGSTLTIKGYKVTQGNYLHLDNETPSYEYTLSIEAEVSQQGSASHLQGTATLRKSVRFRNDSGTLLQSFAIGTQGEGVCQVESLTASSDHADNHSRSFTGGKSYSFDPARSEIKGNPGDPLVIFLKDVEEGGKEGTADNPFVLQDFNVKVEAKLTCTPRTGNHWKLISGAADLVANPANPNTVELKHLRRGGIYKVIYDQLDGSPVSEAIIVLPLAGAEIEDIIRNDVRLATIYAQNYTKNHNLFEQVVFLAALWEVAGAGTAAVAGTATIISDALPLALMGGWSYGNYLGRPDNALQPTVWFYNSVTHSRSGFLWKNPPGMKAVATWYGVPVRIAKLSNFIVAYTVEKIHVPAKIQEIAQSSGTKNDASGDDSWKAGVDLAHGRISLSDSKRMTQLVLKLRRETVEKDHQTVNLWPNLGEAGNFVDPQKFSDVDKHFTHPAFLGWSK